MTIPRRRAELMARLDQRATVIRTPRGEVQVGREGHGPPVLVVHGGPGGFDQGLAWCRHLSESGCEVIAVSRPGYLRTPIESGRSVENQADLYAAVLDVLKITQVAILGFSSGGPSAIHFAARHPERTKALFLDAAVLAPFVPPVSRLGRSVFESRFLVWLSYVAILRWPRLVTNLVVRGVASGLTPEEGKAAVHWITDDRGRLRAMQELVASTAPPGHRDCGWANDQSNERRLDPLPFTGVMASTLVSLGVNDAIMRPEPAATAAAAIPRAELLMVPEGHHFLSLSRNYSMVTARQLALAATDA